MKYRKYMRLSQKNALENNGFSRQEYLMKDYPSDFVYQDVISGNKRERPQLNKMLDELQEGDIVVITEIARLSRSTKDLLELVDQIKNKGAYIVSIKENWLDTREENPMSTFLITIMGAMVQMEREMIAKRIREGCDRARANGVKFGRRKRNDPKLQHAVELYKSGTMSIRRIEEVTGVSKSTISRRVRELREKGEI